MFSWSAGFLVGITATTFLSQLPTLWVLGVLSFLSILLYIASIVLLRQYAQWLHMINAIFIGITWSCYQAHNLVTPLSEQHLHRPIQVTGTVASIPESKGKRLQFEYLVHAIEHQPCKSIRILIAQYHYGHSSVLPLKIGEQWQLSIRLKKARGFWNVGSFDYESFLLQKGIVWTGVIIDKNASKNRRIPQNFNYQAIFYLVKHLIYKGRQYISANIHQNVTHSSNIGLLNAIVTGFREAITQEQWHVMRVTGTTHLFSISGLHISFIGGILYAIVNLLWRYLGSLALYMPAQQAAYLIAWIGALSYSVLSGFALPVQRAIIMVTVFTLALLKRRILPVWHKWCIALIIILLFEPFVVLSESFWLSFGTVAIIFYSLGKRLYFNDQLSLTKRFWRKWVNIHWVIGVGIIPLTLLFFQQIAIWGLIANLIAIPVMGFIILPNVLLGSLLYSIQPSLGNVLLKLGEHTMHFLWLYLSYIAEFPFTNSVIVLVNMGVLLSTGLGIFIYLSPKGLPGRNYLTLLFLLPLLLCRPDKPGPGEIWFTLLDVGQGLAAVVRTQNHLLIYDTGPSLGPEFDTGTAVLLPYLKQLNVQKIDKLMISHGDNDHSGGAQSILQNMPVNAILASQPEQLKHPLAQFGYAGQSWEWDHVQFRILHPPLTSSFKGNDNSCVLHISNGTHSILLPGDIHRKAEKHLLKHYPNIKSTILVAPHHGSKTSSSLPFIEAVAPRYVLFPVGYRNRFHFPHAMILKRYTQFGSQTYCTAKEGAITIKLGIQPEKIDIQCYAKDKARFWKKS